MSDFRAVVTRADVIAHLARRLEFAARGADMVHRYLRSKGIAGTPDQPRPIHPEIALELWGVLQIGAWEAAGLRQAMGADLPPAEQAQRDFNDRLQRSSAELLAQRAGTKLSGRVMDAWLLYCDSQAPRYLGIDVVVAGRQAEMAIRRLADFLWRHRQLGRREDKTQ